MHRTAERFWSIPHCISKKSENSDLQGVGLNYRALAFEDGEDFIWVWVGTHDEYMRMIK